MKSKKMKYTDLALGLGVGFAVFVAACSSSTSPDTESLRAAISKAKLSLGGSAVVAQNNVPSGVAVKAALIPESDPVFSVGAVGSGSMHEVRVDAVSGSVLANTEMGTGNDPCPGSIPLKDAIALAEARIRGVATQIQPDDDNECHREVIVLANNDKLWEVKVASDGAILEVEEADSDD
jgi:hypothetical protein